MSIFRKIYNMKTRIISLLAFFACIISSCAGNNPQAELFPLPDTPTPRVMQRSLFSDAPDSLITALGLQDGIPSSVNAFLVKANGLNILFDAANGAENSQLMAELAKCCVAPEDIDMIYLTHLHGDHIGGLMQKGVAAFPNAELYINIIEYDSWMAMPQEKTARLRNTLQAYKVTTFLPDKSFWQDNVTGTTFMSTELPGEVTAIGAYGHTPGHTIYLMGNVLIAGDFIHGMALQAKYPEFCAAYDMDKDAAVATRKGILKMAAEKGLEVYGMHLPAPYSL